MAAKVEMPNLDDLRRRYLAGETVKKLSEDSGISMAVLYNRFRGIQRDRAVDAAVRSRAGLNQWDGRRIEVDDLQSYIDRYVAGESEKRIAAECGLTRGSFRRRLLKAGIQPRGRSASMYIRMAQTSAAERKRLTEAAHDAVRGSTMSEQSMMTRARTIERLTIHAAPVELELATRLRSRGLVVTQQKAVGKYNVDVAIEEPRIAVEVFGGNFHSTGRHAARHIERTEQILNEGWAVVIVWVDGRRYPLGPGCDEYIIALVDKLRGDPSSRRQYRVILGNGEPAPVCQNKLNTRTVVERLGCRNGICD